MKCPKCDGKGTVLKIIYEDWQKDEIVRSAVKCPRCNGSGEVQMTNEEWLRSATFEELAGAIYEWHTKGYARGRLEVDLNPITEVVEWLKQLHREE